MRLQINNDVFEVSTDPMKERAKEALIHIINSKAGDNVIMRQTVKGACNMALPYFGLSKPDRNSDPIEMVVLHIADLIFGSLDVHGLELSGKRMEKDIV